MNAIKSFTTKQVVCSRLLKKINLIFDCKKNGSMFDGFINGFFEKTKMNKFNIIKTSQSILGYRGAQYLHF